MFDGKMLRGATGTPMRRIGLGEQQVRRRRARAVDVGELDDEIVDALRSASTAGLHSAAPRHRQCRSIARASAAFAALAAARRSGVRHLEQELLHVPRAGRTALGAQAAVQAHVLVLGHDAAGLQPVGRRRGPASGCAPARSGASRSSVSSPFGGEGDAVHRADVDAGVALDAQLRREHRLHVAVEAALRLRERQLADRSRARPRP